MFNGTDEVAVDSKGRMPIPSRYRSKLSERYDSKVVVSRALSQELENVLCLYTPDIWEEIKRSIRSMPNVGSGEDAVKARKLERFLIGGSRELTLDDQGRILVPAKMREKVELSKRAVLVASSNKLEIWPEDKWVLEDDENSQINYDEVLQKVEGLRL